MTLNASGTVTKTSTGGGTVRKSKVTISKIDAQTEKPLVGAKLQILNENKEVLYTWSSTEKPYVINGLAVGKYYIKEETAPEGYALSEDMIEFEIKSRYDDQIFFIENTAVVEVPDTGLSKMALMVLGTLISLAGIGLIVYGIIKIKNSEA